MLNQEINPEEASSELAGSIGKSSGSKIRKNRKKSNKIKSVGGDVMHKKKISNNGSS